MNNEQSKFDIDSLIPPQERQKLEEMKERYRTDESNYLSECSIESKPDDFLYGVVRGDYALTDKEASLLLAKYGSIDRTGPLREAVLRAILTSNWSNDIRIVADAYRQSNEPVHRWIIANILLRFSHARVKESVPELPDSKIAIEAYTKIGKRVW